MWGGVVVYVACGGACVWGGSLSLPSATFPSSVGLLFSYPPFTLFSSSLFFLLLVVSWCCVGGVVWEEYEIFSAKLKLTNSSYLTSSLLVVVFNLLLWRSPMFLRSKL